ncbi:hypothetical protein MVEN_00483400 [Mycena venus]|uniref:Uncharacterized protein n=1 Tax=Mycena venus TaxID=2733690 RepID=A0A8H7DAX9_9AGAR|nr:hypothetical protein MVEN_00483400 [Mycena venus]
MAKCIKEERLLRKAPVRSSQLTPPMVNYKSFLAITLITLFSTASAAPAKPGADVSGTLELCTGPEVGVDCFGLSLSGSDSSSCLAFAPTGGIKSLLPVNHRRSRAHRILLHVLPELHVHFVHPEQAGPLYLRGVGICQLYQGSRAWWTLPISRSR